MIKTQYFWKLWDAANLITGFAATQALAFAFLFMSKDNLDKKVDSWSTLLMMIFFLVVGSVIYGIGIKKALNWAKKLITTGEKLETNKEDLENILSSINKSANGRILVVVFFTVLDICVLCIVSPCVQI